MPDVTVSMTILPALVTVTALSGSLVPQTNALDVVWVVPDPTQGVGSVGFRYRISSPASSWSADGDFGLGTAADSTHNHSIISGLTGGTAYDVQIWPVVNGVPGPVTTMTATPMAPLALTVNYTMMDSTTVRLSWKPAVVVTIAIKEPGSDSFDELYTGLGSSLPTGEQFVYITELTPGAEYQFSVSA